jgi:DNA-binding GntR family transcriptional regulator
VPKEFELDPYLIEVLLPDLVGHDRRPASYILYLWLWAMTRGRGRPAAFFSYQMMTDRTGLSKSAAQRAVAWLERRQLLRVRKRTPTAVPEYSVLTPWRR